MAAVSGIENGRRETASMPQQVKSEAYSEEDRMLFALMLSDHRTNTPKLNFFFILWTE